MKQLTLFGDEETAAEVVRPAKDDYSAFVEKFKPKLTTDDCYTPPAIYEIVKDYALRLPGAADISSVVRPFYPGGQL